MTYTEWTTIFVNSQTRKLPTPTHKLTNQHARLLVNPSTRQLKTWNLNLESCQLFSVNFNIMSVRSVHQSRTLPQKIDSREGLF